jgi:hypothetical protein
MPWKERSVVPTCSTIHAIMDRHGLVTRQRRSRTKTQGTPLSQGLGLSLVALVCTIIIFLVPLRATVNLVRRERRRGHVGTPWTDLGIFAHAPPSGTSNGMLLFGVSTAMVFAVMLWLIQGRFKDLKD